MLFGSAFSQMAVYDHSPAGLRMQGSSSTKRKDGVVKVSGLDVFYL